MNGPKFVPKTLHTLICLTNFIGGYIIVKIRILTTTIDIVKVGIATAFTVLIGSGLLFGTIKTIDAIQIANPPPPCEQRTVPDCIDEGHKPEPGLICPNPKTPCLQPEPGLICPNPRTPCPLQEE